MATFNLPDLGEGLTEATLLSWLVGVGDLIAVDQPIAEVETAKASIEVPAPFAGAVSELHGEPGESVLVGAPLITVRDEPAGALPYREEERAGSEGSGNVLIGYGTSASEGAGRRRRRRPARTLQDAGPGSGHVSAAPVSSLPVSSPRVSSPPVSSPRVSSPLVRRLARERGVSLHSLTGSGPGGLILRDDVLSADPAATDRVSAAVGTTGGAGAAEAPDGRAALGTARPQPDDGPAPAGADRRTGLGIERRVPMSGIRRTIAENLSRSRREIPEATVWQDVDMTDLLTARARMKESDPRGAPSVMAILARFAVAGLRHYPELATRLEDAGGGGQEMVYLDGVNLGFAAQTPRGLMVPVVHRAERLSARGLHDRIAELTRQAREGGIAAQDLRGGTFTVNNYGSLGSDGATPIINHPEVAILGIGRTLERPWVVAGELCVRSIATLTLAFDHRVCDGAAAGGFLNHVAGALENPLSALLDL